MTTLQKPARAVLQISKPWQNANFSIAARAPQYKKTKEKTTIYLLITLKIATFTIKA